jgi:hypothetical protein
VAAASRAYRHARSQRSPTPALDVLRIALQVVVQPTVDLTAAREHLAECNALVQDEDAPGYNSGPVLDNAIAAVCYCLEGALGFDNDAYLWTATQAHEAVDYLAHTALRSWSGSAP